MHGPVLDFLRREAIRAADTETAEFIDGLADRVEDIPEPTVKRYKSVEPFVKGGTITHTVWRCANCDGRIEREFRYCPRCGWRLANPD